MKNFKKVIAFLMVAAMTLGMGLTAFADDAVDLFEASKVEAVESGNVTISLIAKQDVFFKAGDFKLELNADLVNTDAATVKGLQEADGDLLLTFGPVGILGGSSYVEETATVNFSGAGTSSKTCTAKAGEALVTVTVPLKGAIKDGDVIGTFKFSGTLTTGTDAGEVEILPQDVEVKVSAAASSSEESSSDVQNPTDPTPGPTDPTNAPTTAAGGQGTTAAPTAAPTTKALPKADDIKTVTNALEACADLVENGNYNAVLNIAKKLDASCFTSKEAYDAFAAALKNYEAVLANPNATEQQKIDAYNKMIELMQESVLTQKGKDTLMNNVKQALTTTPATTKAGNGKTKTGDTAPVAALIIVAIAAFGTAVVVYRKKVNA